MKKFIAIAMVAVMMLMTAVTCFAGYTDNPDGANVAFTINKAYAPQELDGKISDGEYYPVELKQSWISAAYADDGNADYALDISKTKLYMSWDEEYVYMASELTPNTFWCEWDDDPASMWYSGCMQVNYAAADASGTDRLEVGIGVSSKTGNLLSNTWNDFAGNGYVPSADNFIVVNNGGTLVFEYKTPWSEFNGNAKVDIGSQFGVCLVWSKGVEQDYVHTQLAAGCTGDPGKDAARFAKVTLAEAIIPVVEEVEEEATAADAAPAADAAAAPAATAAQTGDATVLFVMLAVVALGAAVVVTKKVRN